MSGYDPNVQLVCPRCRKPDGRYFDLPLGWFVGRSVKIAFQSQCGFVEHMWVVVTGVEAGAWSGSWITIPSSSSASSAGTIRPRGDEQYTGEP